MESTKHKKLNIAIAYFLIYVVWGSTYYITGLALKDFPPFLLGAIRFSGAGILLMAWCFFVRGENIFQKKLLVISAVGGIVLLFVDMLVIMLAQRYVSSSLVAIIASSTTFWITALDFPMWKRNFRTPSTIIGLAIGFLGVLVLYLQNQNSDNSTGTSVYGIYILLLGCISWACGTLFIKYYSSYKGSSSPFVGAAWQMTFASVMFWLFSIISGETGSIKFASISQKSWLSLIYLIIMGSVLAYSAYIWLLKVRPATEVGTHAYVNPLIAVFIGLTIGNEYLSFVHLSGLFLIICSVILITLHRKTN
ncbi:EamA family transporter [Fluviicola sp.]|uniref:EamA family transporter n=1 Tax=Fluviicola sp. TaxID=1917219 RepID=UPI0031CEDC91